MSDIKPGDEAPTKTLARILGNGFNEHIRLHGPHSDEAGQPAEAGDGHSFTVTRLQFRWGTRYRARYRVTVELLPDPVDGDKADCRRCGENITLLGGLWTADDGKSALCSDSSLTHEPEDG